MLAFSGDGFINIKVSDFPVHRQTLQVSARYSMEKNDHDRLLGPYS